MFKVRRAVAPVFSFSVVLFSAFSSIEAQSQALSNQTSKRAVTVEDAIVTTRLAEPNYVCCSNFKGQVAHFSPDGKLFVIVLRRGNLNQNTNEFSILLYRTADALLSAKADILLKMSSSSNRDAITQPRWLSDDNTILFLGENPGEVSQVYEVSIRTRQLKRRTSSATPITDYNCTPDGRTILFEADTPQSAFHGPSEEQIQRLGVVITDQALQDLLRGHYGQPNLGQELFIQEQGKAAVNLPIPVGHYVLDHADALYISPDGKHALVRVNLIARALPKEWVEYTYDYGPGVNDSLHRFFDLPLGRTPTPFAQFLLVDKSGPSIRPLWNAPVLGQISVAWAQDGQSVFLAGARLPLERVSVEEHNLRQRNTYDVAVSLLTGQSRKLDIKEFPKAEASAEPLEVTIEEDVNTPPRIFVIDAASKRRVLLLDLNSQFSQLDFGKVETIEWTIDGVNLIGGLYLPPNFVPGRKYPLVIQTHGFASERFSMDGEIEWSSGFAARPLAANGFLVLQLQEFKTRYDHDHYNDGNRFGITSGQSGRNLNVRGIEAAIDHLDGRGLIEKNRVGIVGFSRSVSVVGYLLTHSSKRFAAASLVDGVDGGYFQELVYPQFARDKDESNGGVAPFGEGLRTWLKESPSFALGNVSTPVRLLALGKSSDVSELWEWFASLSLQKKPVDYVLLPDAAHLVVKPWERIVAQQGLVDWFRFWLKGEQDPDPGKADQYRRWRELRQKESQLVGGKDRDPTRVIENQ